MSNHVKYRDAKRKGARAQKVSRNRMTRPKTFKSEESAKAWAEKNKIKNFKIENLKIGDSKAKKLRLVVE